MGPALRSHRRVGGVHPEPLCDAHTICGGYCDELSDVGPSTFPFFVFPSSLVSETHRHV